MSKTIARGMFSHTTDPSEAKARKRAYYRVDIWGIPVGFNPPCALEELQDDARLNLLAHRLIRIEGVDPKESVCGGYGRRGLHCIRTARYEYRERNNEIEQRKV